jgi:hypothetical protein
MKKIKITEDQLKFLMENKDKEVNEQIDSENGDDFDSMKKSIGDSMNQNHEGFKSPEDLISSISERLSNAISLQEWDLVKQVLEDTNKYNSTSAPEIGEPSSVLDDTPEEKDERNYGIEESIKKIRSDFKRFI